MSTYQRYLRERKEVQIEETNLEETGRGVGDITDRPVFRGKVSADKPKEPTSKKLTTAQVFRQKLSGTPPPPKEQPVSADTEQTSGKTKTSLKNKLFPQGVPKAGDFPKGEPEQKPESPATQAKTSPSAANDIKSVTGNTASEIATNAGLSPESAKNIQKAFEAAARKYNLKIKPGFLR